ncbi:peroxiredoxin-like family protein [Paraflavisolibacter sp. H34]|uniref:peroxiredoxin-like family protein n=1 Tax=Huijunlia imazamoxiresistens TaxID=3127457 RepID=UPI003015D79D
MKKLFVFFLAVLSFGSAVAQDKPEGLFINSKAPDFRVADQTGIDISLKELRRKGPVVVLFYRGYWDPYCIRELTRFQDSVDQIIGKGARLVAITPEGKDGIDSTIAKSKAVFSILHDEEMKIAKAWQGAFQVDERTLNRYKSFGNDLLAINNQKQKAFLAIPAVYVVNKEGFITYRFFNDDPKKRPSVREILEEIK